MQVSGIVNAPSSVSNADGGQPVALMGKAAELVVAELHGKWYTAAYRGRVYFGTTATAGTTIPVQAANLASTFTLFNPAGSSVICELITYEAAFEAATEVVSDVSLYFQTGLVLAPTSLTSLTIQSALLGNGHQSIVALYSAATLVGTPTKGPLLFGPGAVTSTNNLPLVRDFDGRIIVPQGGLVTTAGNAAQASAASQGLAWAEWPV